MRHTKKNSVVFVVACLLCFLSVGFSHAETRLATWNIEHLGERGQGCLVRDDKDYKEILRYVTELDADIIALQEIASLAAARLIFPEDEYNLVISDRSTPSDRPYCWGREPQKLGDLRTGFAIRRGIEFEVHEEFSQLGDTAEGPNSMPWGVDITVTLPDGKIRLLSLHLTSGCAHSYDRDNKSCETLFSQAGALRHWISERQKASENYGLLGDFNRYWSSDDEFFDAALFAVEDFENWYSSANDLKQVCRSNSAFIDHILLRLPQKFTARTAKVLDIQTFDQKNYKISDHCPVYVSF